MRRKLLSAEHGPPARKWPKLLIMLQYRQSRSTLHAPQTSHVLRHSPVCQASETSSQISPSPDFPIINTTPSRGSDVYNEWGGLNLSIQQFRRFSCETATVSFAFFLGLFVLENFLGKNRPTCLSCHAVI